MLCSIFSQNTLQPVWLLAVLFPHLPRGRRLAGFFSGCRAATLEWPLCSGMAAPWGDYEPQESISVPQMHISRTHYVHRNIEYAYENLNWYVFQLQVEHIPHILLLNPV